MFWMIVLSVGAVACAIYGGFRHELRWHLLALFMLAGAVYWFFQP